MRVELYQIPGTVYDITPYLNHDADIILAQETERAAFERVVEDVGITVSNQSGIFHQTIFAGVRASTKLHLKILSDSNRVLFKGRVKLRAEFDVKQEWLEFDAFSDNRAMWDLLAYLKVWTGPAPVGLGVTFLTLDQVMSLTFTKRNVFSEGIVGPTLNLGVYANRPIRAFLDDTTGQYGNEGRLQDLDPNMTIKQLHEEMAKYYNAEFYVDPETSKWTMVRRNTMRSLFAYNIDTIIVDDQKIAVAWADEGTQNYIETFAVVDPIPNPSFYRFVGNDNGHLENGIYWWLMTAIVDGAEILVSAPPFPHATAFSNDPEVRFRAYLRMPAVQYTGITARLLYRRNENNPEFGYRRIVGVLGNDPVDVTDYLGPNEWSQQPALPYITNVATGWIGYDEATSAWSEFIPNLANGANRPPGSIKDVIPRLRFVDPGTTNVRPFHPIEAMKFFAKDNTTQNIREQFLEMFLTKRRVRVAVKGTDFRLGDGLGSGVISAVAGYSQNANYIVKRTANNLTKETTVLEMLPL